MKKPRIELTDRDHKCLKCASVKGFQAIPAKNGEKGSHLEPHCDGECKE